MNRAGPHQRVDFLVCIFPSFSCMDTQQLGFLSPPPPEARTWKSVLEGEKEKPYFRELMMFLEGERASGKSIYPKNSDVFNSLMLTPFESVKVVIIGQDPYHGPG